MHALARNKTHQTSTPTPTTHQLAVRPGAFLECNGWSDDFDKPLGEPLGPAAKSTDGAFLTRHFASGTSVQWDLKAASGVVHWAGDPPTPAPAPPAPTPPPVPTPAPPPMPAFCGKPMAGTRVHAGDLGKAKVTPSFAECCEYCHSVAACGVWCWHGDKGGDCHLHAHGAAGKLKPGSGPSNVVAGVVNASSVAAAGYR